MANTGSKLRRSLAQSVFEPICEVDWSEDLEGLIQGRFFELLGKGQWWGASIFGSQGSAPEEILAQLAKIGARCACVGARAGVAGYIAVIAHPHDAFGWPTRVVSLATGPGKRPHGVELLFLPMRASDFPAPPQVFQTNQEQAMAARRSIVERAEIAKEIQRTENKSSASRL